jgi:hypothetical protein
MANEAFTEFDIIPFHQYGNTECHAAVIRSNKFNKYYVGIVKTSHFFNEKCEPKHSYNCVCLPITAAKELAKGAFNATILNAEQRIKADAEGVYHTYPVSLAIN